MWVLRSQGAVVHLARLDPGATSVVDVHVMEPVTAQDAELAVDGTGRPLVVTVGVGVQLHACRDDACSRVRSGLVSTTGPRWGLVDRELDPFLVIDGHGRPAVLVERPFAEAAVVQCREPRCGL